MNSGRAVVIAVLAVAGLLGQAALAGAQTMAPLEWTYPIPVWNGFYVQHHWGWTTTWSAPLAPHIFSVQASWPIPPIGLTDEQRCSHSSNTTGGPAAVAIPWPTLPGSYSVTLTLKQCRATPAGYEVTELASQSGWGIIEDDGTTSGGPGATPPPRLTILSQTTRWRPQRDPTQPIVVRFSSPSPLDPATVQLEVQTPAGPAGYVATVSAVQPVQDALNEYTIAWNGPWRFDSGGGVMQPLPAGNYPVIVKGRIAGSTDEIASPPYRKVSLVEVAGITFLQCNMAPTVACGGAEARLGQNMTAAGVPLPGGGVAVFPDAGSPGGPMQANLLVSAALLPDLGPDTSQVTVHFKWIDVDDPSASAAGDEIDDDTIQTTSADNRGESATIDASAGGDPAVRGASAKFRVSTGQGNNYRVAASTFEPWLAAIDGDVSSQTGGASAAPGYSVTPLDLAVQVSDLLTVWRTLHLELNYVETAAVSQDYFDLLGNSTDIRPVRLVDANATFVERRNGRPRFCDHCERDGWRGAELWPRDPLGGGGGAQPFPLAGAFSVIANRKTRLEVPPGSQLRTVASTGDPYRVRDDYWVDLSRWLPLDLTREWLERNYIAVDGIGVLDQRISTPIADDVQNLEPRTLAGVGVAGTGTGTLRDVASSPEYWAVFGLTGYEGSAKNSCDPCRPGVPGAGATYGQTVGGTASWPRQDAKQPAFALYLETLRDRPAGQLTDVTACTNGFESMLDILVAHEILAHSLDLGTTVDTLTDEANTAGFSCAGDPRARQLFRRQELVLRTLTQPLVNAAKPRP